MMLRNVLRGVLAVSVVLGLVGVGAVANAAPFPVSGPLAGGTEVVVGPPEVTFTQVSAGTFHSVALTEDGAVYAWGRNINGQLGDGSNLDSNVPVRVETPEGVTFTQVSAGSEHSVALAADGTAYAWGANRFGQLGDGDELDSGVPVRVQMPEGVSLAQVSAGGLHTVALAVGGTAYAWGYNWVGQLGDGTDTSSGVPVRVQMPEGVSLAQVSAGGLHTVALAVDGAAYAWGSNRYGQLGDNTGNLSSVPVLVEVPAGVIFAQVSAGNAHSLAVDTDGAAYAWGDNWFWQLGDGSELNSSVPVLVEMPEGVAFAQVSAGETHSLAVGMDGAAYAWGVNGDGQLGDGTGTSSGVPVRVEMPQGVTFAQVSAGYQYSVALAVDGAASAWGANGYGQLGDGTNDSKNIPTPVLAHATVAGVSFGGISATGLVDNGDGSWTAVTPPHAAGPVDVVVSWALNGVAQPDITYAGAFTYINPDVAPTVTDPVDQAVSAGNAATFTVDTTGTPAPSLSWEFSTNDGVTWSAVGAADGKVSGDGKTLTVTATEALSGTLYRVTAENSAGAMTSAAARLTVSAAPVTDPVAPPVTDPAGEKDLARTGSDVAPFIVGAALITLVGAGLVLASRRKQA